MEFMLLLHGDEKAWAKRSQEETARIHAAYYKYTNDLTAAGKMRGGAPLERTDKNAARVTLAGGRKKVVDGPFTEAREVCGGYYIIEAASREEALEWAARCPAAEEGTVEVRQVMAMSMDGK